MPPIRFLDLSNRSAQIRDRLCRVVLTCELHGPCQVSRGYRIGLSADYIYLDLPTPYMCMCRLLATILMARGRWGFQFSSDSDD